MDKPSIEIGTIVTHPSVKHHLEVFRHHYTTPPGIIRLGHDQPDRVYSGKVRCKYTDEKGIEHKYHLFKETELIIIK